MTEMTLKRLMELAGVDVNTPKVVALLESDQRVTLLVKQLEDDMVEYANEHGGPETGSDLDWAPPSWNNGMDIWNEVRTRVPAAADAYEQLTRLIGHDKTKQLVIDISNSVFDDTQKDDSPEPYLG